MSLLLLYSPWYICHYLYSLFALNMIYAYYILVFMIGVTGLWHSLYFFSLDMRIEHERIISPKWRPTVNPRDITLIWLFRYHNVLLAVPNPDNWFPYVGFHDYW